jgi:DNA polymerase III epsilon subunit-like protein
MTQDWMLRFQAILGPLPKNYLSFDLETSGLSHEKDFIVQIGWCEVRGGHCCDRGGIALDWTRHPDVSLEDLAGRMADARRGIESRGGTYHWDLAALAIEGEEPLGALAGFLSRLLDAEDEGLVIVGHNASRFDSRFIEAAAGRWLNYRYRFRDEALLDSGAMEKACQLGELPRVGETFGSFSRRVINIYAAGVYWNLSLATKKYRLEERYPTDGKEAHDATHDSLLTHFLIETYREIGQKGTSVYAAPQQTQGYSPGTGNGQSPGGNWHTQPARAS